KKINGRTLLMIEKNKWKSELGLKAFGDRKRFEVALAELRRQWEECDASHSS
ncbi:hypothetical protein HDU80_002639, partial [Chytriomyces hyalinus]